MVKEKKEEERGSADYFSLTAMQDPKILSDILGSLSSYGTRLLFDKSSGLPPAATNNIVSFKICPSGDAFSFTSIKKTKHLLKPGAFSDHHIQVYLTENLKILPL